MVGKQAKILSDAQLNRVLREVEISRHPERDRVMVLLSHKAGLRAKEISAVTWDMITDADGNIGREIALRDKTSEGKNGGRHIPLNPDLRSALVALAAKYDGKPDPDARVAYSDRDIGLSAGSVTVWFHRLYARLGLRGASSHSGRRTFVTRLAKTIVAKGGSLRDVQQLAGHASLQTTQRYIEGSSDAKRLAVEAL
jgi:integrase/recombinase XerC